MFTTPSIQELVNLQPYFAVGFNSREILAFELGITAQLLAFVLIKTKADTALAVGPGSFIHMRDDIDLTLFFVHLKIEVAKDRLWQRIQYFKQDKLAVIQAEQMTGAY